MEGEKKVTIICGEPRINVDMTKIPLYDVKTKLTLTYEEMMIFVKLGMILSEASFKCNMDHCLISVIESEIVITFGITGEINFKKLSEKTKKIGVDVTETIIQLSPLSTITFIIKR